MEDLKKTLAYLNNQSQEEAKASLKCYLKEGLIKVLIKRILNLLPNDCSSCNEPYWFNPDEITKINCLDAKLGEECLTKESRNSPKPTAADVPAVDTNTNTNGKRTKNTIVFMSYFSVRFHCICLASVLLPYFSFGSC